MNQCAAPRETMQPPAASQQTPWIRDHVHPQQQLNHPHGFCSLCTQALSIRVPAAVAMLHRDGVPRHDPSLLAGPHRQLSCGPPCVGLWYGRTAAAPACREETFIGALGSKRLREMSSLSDTARPCDSFQPHSTGCGTRFLPHCPTLVPQRSMSSGSSAWEH